jgi:hypothetical protein
MERFHVTVACPTCGTTARLVAFETTERAVVWTDGYRGVGGVPPPPQITRCWGCKAVYWTETASAVSDRTPPPEAEAGRVAVPPLLIEALDEHFCFEALDAGLAPTPEYELALRVLTWWRGNDQFRKSAASGRFPTDPRAIRNLERLVELCTEGDHEVLLTRVEALRQLGRFDDASDALSGLCKRLRRRRCETRGAHLDTVTRSRDPVRLDGPHRSPGVPAPTHRSRLNTSCCSAVGSRPRSPSPAGR